MGQTLDFLQGQGLGGSCVTRVRGIDRLGVQPLPDRSEAELNMTISTGNLWVNPTSSNPSTNPSTKLSANSSTKLSTKLSNNLSTKLFAIPITHPISILLTSPTSTNNFFSSPSSPSSPSSRSSSNSPHACLNPHLRSAGARGKNLGKTIHLLGEAV